MERASGITPEELDAIFEKHGFPKDSDDQIKCSSLLASISLQALFIGVGDAMCLRALKVAVDLIEMQMAKRSAEDLPKGIDMGHLIRANTNIKH